MHRLVTILVLSALPACVLFDADSPQDPTPPGPGPGPGPGPDHPDPPCDNCTPTIPLDFEGVQPLNPGFPDQGNVNNHIAVGGTHEVTLEDDTELAYAYATEIVDDDVLAVDATDGPHVTLRALDAGLTDLRIVDPTSGVLYDGAPYAMSRFDRAVPVGTEEAVSSSQLLGSATSYVFAPGTRRVGLAYLNALTPANRLVDTSAVIESAGATQSRWDEIVFENATVGTHSITATVGGVETTVEIEVVAGADTVETLFAFDGVACFGAFKAAAFLSGASWLIVVDGEPYVPAPGFELFGSNCIFVSQGTHTVTATAGGKSLTITMP